MHPRKLHPQRSQSHPRLPVQATAGPPRRTGASAERPMEATRKPKMRIQVLTQDGLLGSPTQTRKAPLEARRKRRRTTRLRPAARQGRRRGRGTMHPRKLHPQRSQSHPRLPVQATAGPPRRTGASAERPMEATRTLMSEMWTLEETLLTPKPRKHLPGQRQAKEFLR